MSTSLVSDCFNFIFALDQVHNKVHEDCQVIYHLKSDSIQVTLHVPMGKKEKDPWATMSIAWGELKKADFDVFDKMILKLGKTIREHIGKDKYENCVKAGVIEESVSWDKLPNEAKEQWSEKDFDPKIFIRNLTMNSN